MVPDKVASVTEGVNFCLGGRARGCKKSERGASLDGHPFFDPAPLFSGRLFDIGARPAEPPFLDILDVPGNAVAADADGERKASRADPAINGCGGQAVFFFEIAHS